LVPATASQAAPGASRYLAAETGLTSMVTWASR